MVAFFDICLPVLAGVFTVVHLPSATIGLKFSLMAEALVLVAFLSIFIMVVVSTSLHSWVLGGRSKQLRSDLPMTS